MAEGQQAKILFEHKVAAVRAETTAIAGLARTLASLKYTTEALDEYDLRLSEQNLRDAADHIKSISERNTQCFSSEPK